MIRDAKIERLVQDQIEWATENMRDCDPEATREHLQELSDEELDHSLAMRGVDTTK